VRSEGSSAVGELVCEGVEQSHFAVGTFTEVGLAEGSAHGQLPDRFFNDPSDGFHEVEDEGGPVWVVRVGEAEIGVEAEGVAGEGGFDFGEPHPEVDHGVGRSCGVPVRPGSNEGACPAAEGEPVLGDAAAVFGGEGDADCVVPGGPVLLCGSHFNDHRFLGTTCRGKRGPKRIDRIGAVVALQVVAGDTSLVGEASVKQAVNDLDGGAIDGRQCLRSRE